MSYYYYYYHHHYYYYYYEKAVKLYLQDRFWACEV